jgi:predicted  nucleic acid-binding Zn-ribbon protein
MATPDLPERVTLLERLAEQQLTLNDQLLELTRRLGEEQALHAERLQQHEQHIALLTDISARLETTLEAIRDLLRRGENGRDA